MTLDPRSPRTWLSLLCGWSALVAHAPAQGNPVGGDLTERLAAMARLGPSNEVGEGGHLALVQALRDARNDQCIALVASHPDDQYVLPATYLRRNEGYRVAVVLMTRGEGGQNNEGPEVGDALAALRTLETESCARALGIDVHYVNRADAGYCRTAVEALELWGRATTVRELARAFRRIRPDVVLTTHHPAETHGHDLALVEVLPDAIALAADPSFRTEGLEPIVIGRAFRGAAPGEEPWFELPADEVDADLGHPYRDIAYDALVAAHRSQAPIRPRSDFFAGANRFVGFVPAVNGSRSLYEGLPDLFLELTRQGTLPRNEVHALRDEFDLTLPASLSNRPALATIALALRARLERFTSESSLDLAVRAARRSEALARVALHAAGIHAAVTAERHVVVPGETIRFHVALSSSLQAPLTGARLVARRGTLRELSAANLAQPQPWRIEAEFDVPNDALRDDPLSGLFRRDRFAMPFSVALELRFAGDAASGAPLAFDLELPFGVRPAVELITRPTALLLPAGATSVDFSVRVRRNSTKPLRDKLGFDAPAGYEIVPNSVDVDLTRATEAAFLFAVRVPADTRLGPQVVRARIGATSVRIAVHRVDVALPPDLRVGLIAGADDAARMVLAQLGCRLEILGDDVLPTRRLDDLDTILVDVRALGKRSVARAELARLLQFAADGGRLVVLYHKDSELDVEATGQRFWPEGLDLHLGKSRVTAEDAPVRILLPAHPLLTMPNTIRPEDWDGWTHERGLYFASSWHAAYETPIAFRDSGQAEDSGALLFARTGRGEFVYCALALHRQLKNLHLGACRIFANLVAHRRP